MLHIAFKNNMHHHHYDRRALCPCAHREYIYDRILYVISSYFFVKHIHLKLKISYCFISICRLFLIQARALKEIIWTREQRCSVPFELIRLISSTLILILN